MDVQFVATIAPIVRDIPASRAFYRDALGLSFEGGEGDHIYSEQLDGTKHFGLWPLSEAATACFGTSEWPAAIAVPQASIEFEVPDVAAAAAELQPPATNSCTTRGPNRGGRSPRGCSARKGSSLRSATRLRSTARDPGSSGCLRARPVR
jgi:catechol 2,3-dioxygenase-like lactoylglutathione lyase family enzyme